MSFGSSPPPMIVPPAPTPPQQMTQPTSVKPGKKPMSPTFIGAALTPDQTQTGGGRTLIGGSAAA